MTNLQAIQDQWLQDLIYQVEQLERLKNNLPEEPFLHEDAGAEAWNLRKKSFDYRSNLRKEIKLCKMEMYERWKELLEG